MSIRERNTSSVKALCGADLISSFDLSRF